MLLQIVEKNIRKEFPTLEYSLNEGNNIIEIEGPNERIGNIEIEDDLDEIIVVVGSFTHWHAACYDQTISKADRYQQVSVEVTDFLKALFSNKLVLWGSHQSGGGFVSDQYRPHSLI